MKKQKLITILIISIFIPIGNSNVDGYHPGPGLCSSTYAHETLANEALEMLGSDNYDYVYQEMSRNWIRVCNGLAAADLETIDGNHFLHPYDHNNVNSKGDEWVKENFDLAVSLHSSNPSDAYYYFGKALHVVQDATSPHHSNLMGVVVGDLNGHVAYESAADLYSVWIGTINSNYNGIYSFTPESGHWGPSDPRGWADYGAHRSYSYIQYVDGPPWESGNDYDLALTALLPYAVRLAAGFMKLFVDQVQANYYQNGYVNFNYIVVKNQETGREEFRLNFQCRDSSGNWRSTQDTFNYDISAPSSPKKYWYNTKDDYGQELSSASYEPFSYCYEKNGDWDIRVRLVEYDVTSSQVIVGWLYFEMDGIGNKDHFPIKTNGDQSFQVKIHFN